ncbi:hypothetical protein [Planctomicrobium sp. SH664]|uniref:hypothetical protein n=1 Tax=Planctomicrobium sp. SH664 TaxID=3448125 RepID=UPI003F5BAA63
MSAFSAGLFHRRPSPTSQPPLPSPNETAASAAPHNHRGIADLPPSIRTFRLLSLALCWLLCGNCLWAGEPPIEIDAPMPPPEWALLERALLQAESEACQEFFARYFDERGFLLCVERWGGDDGPDDAIENCNDWPILHALGGDHSIRELTNKALEGHFRQYTLAKTVETPLARDGMYYKEFITQFDWQHNAEGLGVFILHALSDPTNRLYHQRSQRFAGFYLNEDPQAPNYDPRHRIIRSLFNGSRGPLLRETTGLDWAGDPVEVEHRLQLHHGETSYAQMVEHFQNYNDIVGDHPLNLLATCLPLNAFMINGDPKYRDWIVEYVDAWCDRMQANGGIMPSKIGLDGRIGGPEGKWYAGVYGWSFSQVIPQNGEIDHRNRQSRSFVGFMNAYLLTGNDRYLQVWRDQQAAINAQARLFDGVSCTPTMYNDQGWYAWVPGPYNKNALEMYYLSMKPEDRARVSESAWLDFLEGRNPEYPVQALRDSFNEVRKRMERVRQDTSTPDTRLADNPMRSNPARVGPLVQLMLGGIHVTRKASALHCRLRYFDPVDRRPGLPADVAALVDQLTAETVRVTLVNTNPVHPRELIVQAGGYGEHQFSSVQHAGGSQPLSGNQLRVKLAPGAGEMLTFGMQRYVNPPTMKLPWDR